MKRHKDGNPIECNICTKPFYTNHRLKIHYRMKHNLQNSIADGKDFLCDCCGKHFIQYSAFYNHKKQHVIEGEFKCNQCDKVFTQKVKLKIHMRSHCTEKQYMCEMCGYQAKYPEGLRKHRKKHLGLSVKVL